MTRISKSDEFVKRFKVDFGAEILQAIDNVFDEILSSDQFVTMVEGLIAEGEFDDAVYDRLCNSNEMIDRYCDTCENKCSDDCNGRVMK